MLSVCEYQILYRNYDYSYCDNDVWSILNWKTFICIPYSLSALRDFVKALFNKSFFVTSVEVSWEYDIYSKFNSFKVKEQFWNNVFRTIKICQTGEKCYVTHDQDLAFFLFIWAYTYSYWFFTYMVMFFPSFNYFFEEVLKCWYWLF